MVQNTNSGGASGSDTGVVHYYNGAKVQKVNVPAPPPPSQQLSATNKQEGTTPQEIQAVNANGAANQAPSNAPPPPASPQDAHAAMDQNAQAAHGHVQSGPQQAAATPPAPPNGQTPPAPPAGKPKGKVPPQFAKK